MIDADYMRNVTKKNEEKKDENIKKAVNSLILQTLEDFSKTESIERSVDVSVRYNLSKETIQEFKEVYENLGFEFSYDELLQIDIDNSTKLIFTLKW